MPYDGINAVYAMIFLMAVYAIISAYKFIKEINININQN